MIGKIFGYFKTSPADSRLTAIQAKDPQLILKGKLALWKEQGMEGRPMAIMVLSEEEKFKNPDKNSLGGGAIYFPRKGNNFAIVDDEGKLVFDKGIPLVRTSWKYPSDVPQFCFVPPGIKEAHWAYWCKHNFTIILYLDEQISPALK